MDTHDQTPEDTGLPPVGREETHELLEKYVEAIVGHLTDAMNPDSETRLDPRILAEARHSLSAWGVEPAMGEGRSSVGRLHRILGDNPDEGIPDLELDAG